MSKQFDGFHIPNTTPVPDILFDELLSELTGNELKVLLYIIRRTYGFGKTADAISLSQFKNGITTKEEKVLDKGCGIQHNRTILVALNSLEEKGYIISKKRKTSSKDNDTTIYKLRFKVTPQANTQERVVTSGNDGSYFRSPRWLPQVTTVVTSGNTQETVLQETVLQETVLQEEGREQDQPKTHARSLSTISSSLSLGDDLPENVISFPEEQQKPSWYKTDPKAVSKKLTAPPLMKEERPLTKNEQRYLNEQERSAIWSVIEEALHTKFPYRVRTLLQNTKGMDAIIEDGYSPDDIKQAITRMERFHRNNLLANFSLEKLHPRLPGLLADKAQEEEEPTSKKKLSQAEIDALPPPSPECLVPWGVYTDLGLYWWQDQYRTLEEADALGYNGGFGYYQQQQAPPSWREEEEEVCSNV